jgi:hypothetical protein
MSGTPFFITGAACRLKVNNKTMAYATDLQYTIRVEHALPRLLGMYEAYTQEATGYYVNGSFTVIRYVNGLNKLLTTNGAGSPDGTVNSGNGIGTWGPPKGFNGASIVATAGLGGGAGLLSAATGGRNDTLNNAAKIGGRIDKSFDPSGLAGLEGFTIEVIQKSIGNSEGVFARLRNCRITGSDFRVTKRGVATQTFTFQACYADEDSFVAGSSSAGHNLIG